MAPVEKVEKSQKGATPKKDGKSKVIRKIRNFDLSGGIMRYSRNSQYNRKRLWRLKDKKKPTVKVPKKPITAIKEIGGTNNGTTRVVKLKKSKSNYATKARVTNRPTKGCFKRHRRNTRKSMKPGRVIILLAGKHKGKRVILLKVLNSGLLLVTGPFSFNSCPLRRISQRYVIATQTKINVGAVKVPAHINDMYFRREQKKKSNRGEGDIFASKKEKYVPSEQKKQDQVDVDKQVKTAICNHKEKKVLFKYLKSHFALSSSQYPHRLKF